MKINSYQLSQFSWSQEENLRLMKVHPGQVDFPASQVTFMFTCSTDKSQL